MSPEILLLLLNTTVFNQSEFGILYFQQNAEDFEGAQCPD